MRLLVPVLGLALAGCAHHEHPSAGEVIKVSARQTAHAGGWVLEKTGDAVVHAMYASKMGPVARVTDDAFITAKLKGEYGLNPDVKANQIHIKTRDGVVTLKGTVDSAHAAEKAIKRALDTEGVVMVDSELAYPTVENQGKTFVPGEKVKLRE